MTIATSPAGKKGKGHKANGTGPSASERLDLSEILSAMVKHKKGGLGAHMPVDRTGLPGKVADSINDLLEQNQRMREDFIHINHTLLAIKKGNFSVHMPMDRKGSARAIAENLNDIVDLNSQMTVEFLRISKVVGKEGKITQRASIGYVGGGWKSCVTSVNSLIGDLVQPTNEVARVIGAVAKGDLSQSMALTIDGHPVKGEFLRIAKIVNTMVDQLSSFASEVTRVAREVGTEGKLGGQAKVKGVAGTWKNLTDNVNSMAGNLTSQVRNIADVTTAIAKGDLSRKITVDVKGEFLALKNTINTMVDQLSSFASEVTRVAREVGTEGKLGGQAQVKGVAGTWKDLTDNVNALADNLTLQVRNIADVTTAVAKGDLTKKITVNVKGEFLELKNTINTMVDQLSSFASEVTRVAREVGTEGELGGQAKVKGVAGTWKDLTDNVNSMAGNLTSQVRNIADVTTAVAKGDLTKKITLDGKGEVLELKNTINIMVDQLSSFASEVTRVAREVGTEGELGGQAKVKGAAGTWKDLTDNVNQLAANLTTQVRAIAEVATAVTKGDLTRSIDVQAQGEVAALKDNINEMIRNLKDTTHKNTEQDWLKTNLAKFTRILQGQRDLETVIKLILSELSPLVSVQYGAFYLMQAGDVGGARPTLRLLGSYGYKEHKTPQQSFSLGESLLGQCAVDKKRIILTVPSDYINISSALGSAIPKNVAIFPVLFEGQVKAIIELASFDSFSDTHLVFMEQLTESIGIVLNTITANMRTEDLLKQSQSLTTNLQTQQVELKESNEALEDKAHLLSKQKDEIEAKNQEVELAKKSLEEKADQLALTSKYKSQFLANMSHELRTPLNSLLILAKLLYQNQEGNLTDKQIEFAKTVHSSGSDLLALINEILDMSKIESGMITVEIGDLDFNALRDYVDRNFRQVALDRGLEFHITLADGLPKSILTDAKRFQQVLKNLLSNAFKFTERGSVTLNIGLAPKGRVYENPILQSSETVFAFSVSDTGIGIPADKRKIIFEAFQQADMTTSRKYGGTGLGLTISREIAKLLGGEIHVEGGSLSGSVFTLFLPESYVPVTQLSPSKELRPESISQLRSASISPVTRIERVSAVQEMPDDRESISPGDKVLLIVEDDSHFARIILETAREVGFKGLVAERGDRALELAQKVRPDGIMLDIRLPDMNGWRVLDLLKHDPTTRHIPVHVVSVEGDEARPAHMGALACLEKPVTKEALSRALTSIKDFIDRKVKKLLIVEDNDVQRNAMVAFVGGGDIGVTAVATGAEALEALRSEKYDCMVLDLGLSDMTGFTLLEELHKDVSLRQLPVIVYTGKELSPKQEARLKKLAKSIIIKDAQSPDRLLEETSMYLHRPETILADDKRSIIEKMRLEDPALANKTVLIVDDDMRNIFALTSLLEQHKVNILNSESGKGAIKILQSTSGIDVVLMDVMMPDMDGYETMQAIRKIPKFQHLPIVALTAKAMKGDREKCLEAGASDYITKPVDIPQLLSMLRVWSK